MSTVDFDSFYMKFCEVLEIDDAINKDLSLKDIPQYDSMGKITTSLLIEEMFGFQIDYEILEAATSLDSIYKYCISYKPVL